MPDRLHKLEGVFVTITCLFVFLLPCLIPAFACGMSSWVSSFRYPQDVAAIEAQYTEFHQSCRDGNYEAAYNFMSPEYRQTHTTEEFISDFDFLGGDTWLHLQSGHSIEISGNKAHLYPRNQWLPPFVKEGPEYELVKVEGVWYFTEEYVWWWD